MVKEVGLRRQPGCWLRSSHTFKECVIAHWSSDPAPKISGAKAYTEAADSILRYAVVEEHSLWVEGKLKGELDCKEERMPA